MEATTLRAIEDVAAGRRPNARAAEKAERMGLLQILPSVMGWTRTSYRLTRAGREVLASGTDDPQPPETS